MEELKQWLGEIDRNFSRLNELNALSDMDIHSWKSYQSVIEKISEIEVAKKISSSPLLSDSLPSSHQCRYSKAMNQEYPRKCIDCGKPDGNV